ncbi:PLD nuclease N-terminal domain-containing protein [Algoriphagus limi]|uniref:PLD nuclease N-terminal domain-containing protein n=1 Tax=Algoriphagus limi TaxID=2975273 RepID=A0ABT2G6B6_9BACT|nr:PLD nuclease N-terminal domain-containing protein [Algoriphagus limi]MCS5490754.1 PLD nuclease N-terminal domain-containing protein [Algoriphagus limi]
MDLVTPGNGLLIWQVSGFIIAFGYLAFWFYGLIDLVKSDFRSPHDKLIWLLIILFAQPFGVFIYLSMARGTKEKRKFQPNFSNRTLN